MGTYIPPVLPGDPSALRRAARECRTAAASLKETTPKVAKALTPSALGGPAAPGLRTRLGGGADDLPRAASQLEQAADALEQQATKIDRSIKAHDAAVARAQAEAGE